MSQTTLQAIPPQDRVSTQPQDEVLPDWYLQLRPGTSAFVDIKGAPIHYLSWNMERSELPVLLFIHGFRAHAHWWDPVAPFFTENYRVLSMDFSGMGDSGYRATYEVETFADEITGLIEALGLGTVTAIAHSYGGARLLRACADCPELFQHAIIVDSFVYFRDEPGPTLPKKLLGARVHADFDVACARYRLIPDQPAIQPFLISHVARHAFRAVEGGWRLKFDPEMGAYGESEISGEQLLPRITTPVDFIYGEHSKVVNSERAERTVGYLRNVRGPIAIPDSHHHLMLDQPLALVGTLRALLASPIARDVWADHTTIKGDLQ